MIGRAGRENRVVGAMTASIRRIVVKAAYVVCHTCDDFEGFSKSFELLKTRRESQPSVAGTLCHWKQALDPFSERKVPAPIYATCNQGVQILELGKSYGSQIVSIQEHSPGKSICIEMKREDHNLWFAEMSCISILCWKGHVSRLQKNVCDIKQHEKDLRCIDPTWLREAHSHGAKGPRDPASIACHSLGRWRFKNDQQGVKHTGCHQQDLGTSVTVVISRLDRFWVPWIPSCLMIHLPQGRF